MKIFASFTGTLRELKVGSVSQSDLREGVFVFNCTRAHAVEPWEHEPNEIRWFWKTDYEAGRATHQQLVRALMQAESEHRVLYKDEGSVEVRLVFINALLALGAEVIR